MKKNIMVMMAVLVFILAGCFGGSKKEEEKIISKIVLSADKTILTANGEDSIIFTAKGYDQNNAEMTELAFTYYEGTNKLTENSFKTTTSGNFKITAKSGTLASNEIFITAENNYSDFDLVVRDDKTYSIINYKGNNKEVVIPQKINGIKVTSIGERAFEMKSITAVIIPDTVNYIENWAFCNNSLSSLVIPDSVIFIGDVAFMYNYITDLKIGNSVAYIGGAAFNSSLDIEELIIPDSVTYIGGNCFYDSDVKKIIGKSGSAAEKSAKESGIPFEAR